MNFSDERDISGDIGNQGDDLISWDSVLDTDDDGIVSIKGDKNTSSEIPATVFTNENELSEFNSSGADSQVEYISPSDPDEIDEEELKKILGEDNSDDIEYITDEKNDTGDVGIANETPVQNAEQVDAQAYDEEITLGQDETHKGSGVNPVAVALVFAIVVAGIIYYVFTFLSSRNNEDIPQLNNQVQNVPETPENSEVQENNDGAIPVVNEDEASELKPDEEKPEEKKEVVNVIPTGRINPFLPLDKYFRKQVTSVKTINSIDFNSVSVPLPPKQYGELAEKADKLMTISVSGVMYDSQKPSAIINYDSSDYFVQIGDKLNDFRVVDIGPSFVKIALGKNIYRANVGEEFKISGDFYGNVPYNKGSRQYYSSEDEFKNRKYTSDSDVKIYTK